MVNLTRGEIVALIRMELEKAFKNLKQPIIVVDATPKPAPPSQPEPDFTKEPAAGSRRGEAWTDCEKDYVAAQFESFCDRVGLHVGRTPYAIECYIRKLTGKEK